MLDDAIGYPWRGEQNLARILIGGILGALVFFVVPLFLGNGYLVRVVRQVATGDTETPPAWEDWGELFVDGLVSLLISFVYVLVPSVVFTGLMVGISFVLDATGTGGGAMSGAVVGLGLLFGLVAFLVVVTAMYLLPAAWAAYAVTGRFGAAFSPSTLRTVGGDKRYLIGVLIALGINFFAQLAANIVMFTIVGILLIPFVIFYGQVASAYAIGAGVAETPLVEDRVTDGSETDEAVGHSPS